MRLFTASLIAVMTVGPTSPLSPSVHATKLSASGHASTIETNCDLCSNPSVNETPPPSTLQPHRQHHPRDSRPHRLPKGRYKIAPAHKSGQWSSMAGLARARFEIG